jgi:transposase-like protein
MVRNSAEYVSCKDRKAAAADLKDIYLAPSAGAASGSLEKFAGKWDRKRPAISRPWKTSWNEVIPFMKFPPEIRRTYGPQSVYTTDAIEPVNFTLQRSLKTRQFSRMTKPP